MKVVRLEVSNYRVLHAIDITPVPGENVVLVSGPNGNGKSSVLDAIWAALGGTTANNDRISPMPVRNGETEAWVKLTLDDYVIERRWTADGKAIGALRVSTRHGVKLGTPQRVIDNLYSRFTFDPLAFGALPPKEQRAALLSMVTLPYDPQQMATERADLFESRTIIKRDLTAHQARLAAATPPAATAPTALTSAALVMQEIADVQTIERDAEKAQYVHDESVKLHSTALADLADLEAQVAAKRAAVDNLADGVAVALTALASAKARIPAVGSAALAAQLDQIEDLNNQYRDRVAYENLCGDRDALEAQHTSLDDAIKALDKQAADALAAATLPLPGLGYDDDGITLNGAPFVQASAAEKLKVSTAIGMAANPTLRIMTIKDGSLLDAASMQIISDLAAANDYQIWLEVVTETGDGVGIELRDGTIMSTVSPTTLPTP